MSPRQYSRIAWGSCLAGGLFFSFCLLQMNLLTSISITLMSFYKISSNKFSLLEVAYLLSAALFFIPAGVLLDYFSPRKIILSSIGITIFGTIFFCCSSTLGLAMLARFIVGAGYSVGLLGSFYLISKWLPDQLALVNGIITALALIGCLISQTPFVLVEIKFGWHTAVIFDVTLGFLVLLIAIFFVKDPPALTDERVEISRYSYCCLIRKILLKKESFLCAFYVCLINSPVLLFGGLWGNILLIQKESLSQQQASFVISLMFFGLMLGCVFSGWLAKYVQRTTLLIWFPFFSLLFIIPLLAHKVFSLTQLGMLFFLYGLLAGVQCLVYTIVASNYSRMLIGIVTGILSALILLGNAGLQKLFGYLLAYHGASSSYFFGVHYSIKNYIDALYIIPASLVLAFLFALIIKLSFGSE